MKDFCEKVKENVSPDSYLYMSEYIQQYSKGSMKMKDFQDSVKDLIGENKGFSGEFLYVLDFSNGLIRSSSLEVSNNKRKKPDSDGDGDGEDNNKKMRSSGDKTKDQYLSQAMEFSEKVRKKASSKDYLKLLKCLYDYGTGKIKLDGVKIMVADYFPDFIVDFDNVLKFYGSASTHTPSPESQQVDELTPSYQYLPDKLSGCHASGATKLDKQVLNSCCFSKGSFGGGRAKQSIDIHQKMLNEKEDELFERDMLKEWMSSTKKNASELLKAIKEGKIVEPSLEEMNTYLTIHNFRFIAKMYGGIGSLMVDELRRVPEVVLPVIINRLNEKEKEFLLLTGLK